MLQLSPLSKFQCLLIGVLHFLFLTQNEDKEDTFFCFFYKVYKNNIFPWGGEIAKTPRFNRKIISQCNTQIWEGKIIINAE